MIDFDSHLDQLLNDGRGRHRNLKAIADYGPRKIVMQDGQELLNFSSNDYLAMSEIEIKPVKWRSQPSSRLLSGNTCRHLELEDELARFTDRPSALLFPTGYMANSGLIASLAQKGDVLIMDKFNHASLIDGARLSSAELHRYNHLDLSHLEKLLNQHKSAQKVYVVTESLFSMDGDIPDFNRIKELKEEYDFCLIVDEAHSMGVYGEKGQGLLTELGHKDCADVMTYTLSKSFAMQGGVVCGSKKLKDFLVNRCRTQIYTTATPLSMIQVLPERLDQIRSASAQRKKLKEVSCRFSKLLEDERDFWSPIVPVQLGEDDKARRVSEKLQEEGVFCPAILPPTVPANQARLRVSLTSAHELIDVERLFELVKTLG